MSRVSKVKSGKCPVYVWLDSEGLSVIDFALLADVGYTDAYLVLRGYSRALPIRYWKAIAARSGEAVANKLSEQYAAWRRGLHDLLSAVNA